MPLNLVPFARVFLMLYFSDVDLVKLMHLRWFSKSTLKMWNQLARMTEFTHFFSVLHLLYFCDAILLKDANNVSKSKQNMKIGRGM